MHRTYTRIWVFWREGNEETDLLLSMMSCWWSIDIAVFGFVTRAYASNVIVWQDACSAQTESVICDNFSFSKGKQQRKREEINITWNISAYSQSLLLLWEFVCGKEFFVRKSISFIDRLFFWREEQKRRRRRKNNQARFPFLWSS